MLRRFAAYVACLFLFLSVAETIFTVVANQEKRLDVERQRIDNYAGQRIKHGIDYFGAQAPIHSLSSDIVLKTKHKPRILVLGDSYVQGFGLANHNHLWWQQLQRQLLEAGYDVEVIGAGLAGFSTYDEYLMLSQSTLLSQTNPDIIIVGYVTNDIVDGFADQETQQVATAAAKEEKNKENYIRRLWPNIYDRMVFLYKQKNSSKTFIWRGTDSFWADLYERWERRAIQPLSDFIHKNFDEHQVFFVFCDPIINPVLSGKVFEANFDLKDRDAQEYLTERQQIMDVLDRHNIEYYDFTASFLEEYFYQTKYDYREFIAMPVDGHPGPKTTQFCARKILQYLETNYTDVLGEKQTIDTSSLIINDYIPEQLQPRLIRERVFEINYPTYNDEVERDVGASSFLYYPIWEPYIKLNFEFPVKELKSVLVEGNNLQKVKLWINKYNHKKSFVDANGNDVVWDDQQMYPLKQITQSDGVWTFDASEHTDITSLNLYVKTSHAQEEKLRVTFVD